MSSTKKSSPWSPKELLVIVILLALAFVVLQAYIAAGAHAFPNSYKLGGFTVTLGSYMLDVGST